MVKQNMEGIKNLDASVRNMKTDFQKLLVLQNEAIDNNTNIIGDKLTCSDRLKPIFGTNCADILKRYPDTRWKNGVYDIFGLNRTKAVYCDMTTDNGGWTVIQRRVDGSVDFNNNWTEYKNGFGFADHEYWIGNDMLHRLTSQKPQELRVDMERFNGEKAYAVYSRFAVGNETSKYKLEVNGYSGNAESTEKMPRPEQKESTEKSDISESESSDEGTIIRKRKGKTKRNLSISERKSTADPFALQWKRLLFWVTPDFVFKWFLEIPTSVVSSVVRMPPPKCSSSAIKLSVWRR
uniref:Fibrinogen C-terminal domain-containing protein n=1 Tax=Magallana gigas TaxID=29159 RepID=A0A8W8JM99_MAGGI